MSKIFKTYDINHIIGNINDLWYHVWYHILQPSRCRTKPYPKLMALMNVQEVKWSAWAALQESGLRSPWTRRNHYVWLESHDQNLIWSAHWSNDSDLFHSQGSQVLQMQQRNCCSADNQSMPKRNSNIWAIILTYYWFHCFLVTCGSSFLYLRARPLGRRECVKYI